VKVHFYEKFTILAKTVFCGFGEKNAFCGFGGKNAFLWFCHFLFFRSDKMILGLSL